MVDIIILLTRKWSQVEFLPECLKILTPMEESLIKLVGRTLPSVQVLKVEYGQ